MRGFAKLTLTESRLFLREPLGVFFVFLLPIALIIVIGKLYGNTPTAIFAGHGAVDATVPAYIVMIIAFNALIYLPIVLVSYRERGVLRRLQATPLHPTAILAAHATVQLVLTALSALLLTVAALLFLGMRLSGGVLGVLSVLVAFLLGCLAVAALGMVLASVLPTTRVASISTILLVYPLLLFSGVFIPTYFLAPALKQVSAWIPLTYVVQLLQGVWLGATLGDHLRDIAVLLGILLVCTLLAARLFRWK